MVRDVLPAQKIWPTISDPLAGQGLPCYGKQSELGLEKEEGPDLSNNSGGGWGAAVSGAGLQCAEISYT